ncbi:hypothetical protein [Pandoraea apista]|uniref:hypothetical protein n=1 Tax=Pandoraea apista TaxID=93218 RepID=UPI0006592689|nr:hypothetical protein [Pandoraea apista]ALS63635.1 hypothetical protein AT395_00245 [Pandoraea apista]CFB63164.1 hypothetical protein LMG16407_03239 [Pandoraea apista]
MTAFLALLVKVGPWVLGVLGVVFGAFRHQQAKTATAEAAQKVADAQKAQAQNDAALAAANQAGAQTGADNAKVRRDEDATAAGLPAGDAGRVLHNEWDRD